MSRTVYVGEKFNPLKKAESFMYCGKRFFPAASCSEESFSDISKCTKVSSFLKDEDYSYDDFYEASSNSKMDVFWSEEAYYIPAKKQLFEYIPPENFNSEIILVDNVTLWCIKHDQEQIVREAKRTSYGKGDVKDEIFIARNDSGVIVAFTTAPAKKDGIWSIHGDLGQEIKVRGIDPLVLNMFSTRIGGDWIKQINEDVIAEDKRRYKDVYRTIESTAIKSLDCVQPPMMIAETEKCMWRWFKITNTHEQKDIEFRAEIPHTQMEYPCIIAIGSEDDILFNKDKEYQTSTKKTYACKLDDGIKNLEKILSECAGAFGDSVKDIKASIEKLESQD